jgi:hypothetical protein
MQPHQIAVVFKCISKNLKLEIMKLRIKTITASLTVLFAVLFFTSCDEMLFNSIYGNGVTGTETRAAGAFDKISSFGNFNVYIIQDTTYSIEIEAEESIIPYVLTGVINNTLVIKSRDNYNLRNNFPINITVRTPGVEKVLLAGSGDIECDSMNVRDLNCVISGSGNILMDVIVKNLETSISGSGHIEMVVQGDFLDASISGSGYMKYFGQVDDSKMNITGSGDIRGLDLLQNICNVRISGSGSTYVDVADVLDVNISGSGTVYYKGTPAVISSISGSGHVVKL